MERKGRRRKNSFVKFSSLTENQLAILKENHSLTVLQCSTLISSVPARQTTTKNVVVFKALRQPVSKQAAADSHSMPCQPSNTNSSTWRLLDTYIIIHFDCGKSREVPDSKRPFTSSCLPGKAPKSEVWSVG